MHPDASAGPSPPMRPASHPVGTRRGNWSRRVPSSRATAASHPVQSNSGYAAATRSSCRALLRRRARGWPTACAGQNPCAPRHLSWSQRTYPTKARRCVVGSVPRPSRYAPLVAVEEAGCSGVPVGVDRGERRHHGRDAHALHVEVARLGAARAAVRRATRPPRRARSVPAPARAPCGHPRRAPRRCRHRRRRRAFTDDVPMSMPTVTAVPPSRASYACDRARARRRPRRAGARSSRSRRRCRRAARLAGR